MRHREGSYRWRFAALVVWTCVCLGSVSCSSSVERPAASLEAAEILELINEGKQTNDPQSDVEVDLGKFRVTHAVGDEEDVLLLVDFQLFAVVAGQKQKALEAALPGFGNRVRDAVIGLVQSIDTEHLTDPSLAYLKTEIIARVNRVLQERLIKDVAFSDFSVHDAHLAPFPTTTSSDEKPKPSAHGGGHGH